MDNVYAKEFINYLMYIGLISEEGIQQFIACYNASADKGSAKLSGKASVLAETLSSYLSALTKPQLRSCSKAIVGKYAENQQKIRQQYLRTIIYSAKGKAIRSCLLKWRRQARMKQEKTQSSGTIYQSQRLNKSSNEGFFNRQEEYTVKSRKKREKLKSQTEDDFHCLCTFSPKVISTKAQMSPIARNKRAVDRLLEDSNRRNDYFKSINKAKTNVNSNGQNNLKAINKLYQNAKEREAQKKTLQQQIDEERGMTFKPASFTKDSGYEVSSHFHERNKKLIDDRQNFVFVYDYLRQSKFNENTLYNKSPLQKPNELDEEKESPKD